MFRSSARFLIVGGLFSGVLFPGTGLKAQSADLSGNGHGALFLYGDRITAMQQDNATDGQSPLDDAQCVLGSLIDSMLDIVAGNTSGNYEYQILCGS